MKKIGLVTVTYVSNYGSHLQSFALQHVIRTLGYETEIITPEGLNSVIARRRYRYLLSRWYDLGELKGYMGVAFTRLMYKIDKKLGSIINQRDVFFNSFVEKEYTFSPVTYSWDELSSLCEERYSTVVIGSDQNWRPANIAGGYYTIEYVPDRVNKIAYSTSFGISRVIPAQIDKAKKFLKRINHISVREDSGQKIIKDLINICVPVVCDPTILLKQEEWRHFIEEKSQRDLSVETKDPYILCYFLGRSKAPRDFALKLRQKTGLRIVSILYETEKYYKEKQKYYDIGLYAMGPLDFVNLISKAQYICTDSFHGCAFSLIFHKELYAFYKTSKKSKMSVNSRIDSMLEWAGMKNRIITEDTAITESMLEPINYEEVGRRIEEKRALSLSFLKNSLQ